MISYFMIPFGITPMPNGIACISFRHVVIIFCPFLFCCYLYCRGTRGTQITKFRVVRKWCWKFHEHVATLYNKEKRNRTFGYTGIESISLYLTGYSEPRDLIKASKQCTSAFVIKDSKQDNIKFDTVLDAPSSTHRIDDRRHVALYND